MSYSQNTVALDQPYYGAPLGAAVQRFFKKYATFTGRASRSEFWWWVLVNVVVVGVLNILSAVTGGAGGVDEYGMPTAPRASAWCSSSSRPSGASPCSSRASR